MIKNPVTGRRGRVEFVLDALLHTACDQSAKFGDGDFEDTHDNVSDMEEEKRAELEALPSMHALDDEYELWSFVLLGRGFKRGPYCRSFSDWETEQRRLGLRPEV
ncbi:hypothetical protein CYMTET_36657 [Cymbomonas tetramitiformis]|uniref:Uncharacterized protein n=1 Tax=Cymbomonas tetramitiformis TaxID=36881 RepID=A0AAE0CFJ5_9CHLO|nr:hypothetical protein CYMTET_36657 [Cymbomonas tetramitiformis]